MADKIGIIITSLYVSLEDHKGEQVVNLPGKENRQSAPWVWHNLTNHRLEMLFLLQYGWQCFNSWLITFGLCKWTGAANLDVSLIDAWLIIGFIHNNYTGNLIYILHSSFSRSRSRHSIQLVVYPTLWDWLQNIMLFWVYFTGLKIVTFYRLFFFCMLYSGNCLGSARVPAFERGARALFPNGGYNSLVHNVSRPS